MKKWAEDIGCSGPIEFFAYLKAHENDKPLYLPFVDKLKQQKDERKT